MVALANSDAPRWEWRVFGADLSALEARLGAPIDAPHRSDETYLLNAQTPHSAKIRAGELEVKRLLRVDDGLELWSPAFKGEFPLAAEKVNDAFAALALAPPRLSAARYDERAFLSDIVSCCTALRPVTVKKSRRRYSFWGCAAEAVRLLIGAAPLESVAVESEDERRLSDALRELRADPRLNVNFPKGVERAMALTP